MSAQLCDDLLPPGFSPVEHEAFMETVGPIYARPNAAGLWDLRFRATPRHANRFGRIHGGMLTTLADYAIGFNLLKADAAEIQLSTVNLNIDFISAGDIGDWLEVRVQIDKNRGRLRFCSCTVHSGGERLVLRASGVLSAVPLER